MLKTKQVGKYTISQIGPLQASNLRIFQARAEKEPDEGRKAALSEWAVLAACTSPYISETEYLDTPVQELQPLMEAMEEVNTAFIPGGEPQPSKKKRVNKV